MVFQVGLSIGQAVTVAVINLASTGMSDSIIIPLASSSNGRLSRKSWKTRNTPTVYVIPYTIMSLNCHLFRRSHLPEGVKTKSWEARMQKTEKALAIKKLQTELKEEKRAEFQRYIFIFLFRPISSFHIFVRR